MRVLNRRDFVMAALAGGAGLASGGAAAWLTDERPLGRVEGRAEGRTLVIGGGPAGAAAALTVRLLDPRARVLLIERDPTRLAQPESEDARFAPPQDKDARFAPPRDQDARFAPPHDEAARFAPPATAGFERLRREGVEIALDEIVAVDWSQGRAEGFSGRRFAFDQIVMAPGVAAREEGVAGYDARTRHLWPAAWGSRREARRLRAQLAAMPENGHVVLRLPEGPISHPQGPSRRALEIARFLAARKPGARLTVLDAAAGSAARRAFETRRADPLTELVDWRFGQDGRVLAVDAARGALETPAGAVNADVVNFVSAQCAGEIARRAGLTDASGWCPCTPDARSSIQPRAILAGDAVAAAERTALAALAAGFRAGGAVFAG